MNAATQTFLAIGVGCILVTVFISLILVPEWSEMMVAGLIGTLWAEIAFFGSLSMLARKANRRSSIIAKTGIGSAMTIYAIACFTCSAIFSGTNALMLPAFLAIQSALLLLAAISCVAFIAAERKKQRQDALDAETINSKRTGRRGGF